MTHDALVEQFTALARKAWPKDDVDVGHYPHGLWVAIGRDGVLLAHDDCARFRDALGVLAGELSPVMAFDLVERMIRERVHHWGIDVVGFREDGAVHLWDEGGRMGTGASLYAALDNLDHRRTGG
jgi:hypothetical protein